MLCRVGALYLVERLKPEIMAAAATHYQALAVSQARRRALRRLARHPARRPQARRREWLRPSSLCVVLSGMLAKATCARQRVAGTVSGKALHQALVNPSREGCLNASDRLACPAQGSKACLSV